MKKFNIVACVIVLLLAIVSAVFSYFLYEKRVLFLDGWKQMSDAIHESAQIVDKRDGDSGSGNKFAGELTEEKLSHKTYTKDGMAKQLSALVNQSKEFVKQYQDLVEMLANTKADLANVTGQRNQMAEVFAAIGNKVKAGTGDRSKFEDLTGYKGQIDRVSRTVTGVVNNRDAIAGEVAGIVRNNGGTLNADSLKSGSVRSAIAPLNNVINNLKGQRNNYGQGLKLLASQLKVNFNDNGSRASADTVVNAVRKRLGEVSSLQSQLSSARRENGNLKNQVSRNNSQIAQLNQKIAEYKRILELKESDADPKAWRRGSAEARSAVSGKVLKVSPEYGYVVIDIGTITTVRQQIGNKTLTINPDLEDGLSFNIVRDGKFIATVSLTNVGEKESTANIPADKVGQIKVGDEIVFKK